MILWYLFSFLIQSLAKRKASDHQQPHHTTHSFCDSTLLSLFLHKNTKRINNNARLTLLDRKDCVVDSYICNDMPETVSSAADKTSGVGNYRGYYTQRADSSNRLQYFKREWFWNKFCLDIGCNSGHLTFHVAEKYSPKSILGIDVDSGLIKRANNRLTHTPAPPSAKSSSLMPRAVRLKLEQRVQYPRNLKFRCCDIVSTTEDVGSRGTYQTVLCCSVSKWIHLNHGDEGLLQFFQNVFDLLAPGGIAILEYQPWKSYERNKNTSEITKRVFKTLSIKPEHFETILTESIGFSIIHRLGTPLQEAKGFNRPILVLSKPDINVVVIPRAVQVPASSNSEIDGENPKESKKRKLVLEPEEDSGDQPKKDKVKKSKKRRKKDAKGIGT